MLTRQALSTGWTFRAPNSARWLAARVPGCIHTDLLRHRLIPDPFHGRNELDLQWIEQRDWTYRCRFRPAAALLRHEHLDLVFDGLDTVATVRLNGAVVLRSDNMFHAHRVPVRDALRRGENLLEITFASALDYIRATRADFTVKESNDPVGGRYRIRKQQSQFGWDWGPRFVTAGLWRPARLEAWSGDRLASVYVAQDHTAAPRRVGLAVSAAVAAPKHRSRCRAVLSLDGRELARAEGPASAPLALSVDSPRLWWPAGQGEQPLHELRVELLDLETGRVMDSWIRRVGLRSIELDREPDGHDVKSQGGMPLARFGFRVNGRLVFAKGANWIPAHAFVHGLGHADYARDLRAARDAHMNTIRLWGGGIYEHEAFYDLCDELGLLVWHDLMFACSLYPADADFLASVRREVVENAARVRHHACLALWCGNNENIFSNWGALERSPERRADYRALFLDTIPAALLEAGACQPYLHSSPCTMLPGEPDTQPPSHDEHDWEVWHARRPVEYYETTHHRFASEFGMQSFPSERLARTFCPPDQLDPFSPVFQNHQKNRAGNQIILDYVTRLYRYPRDYASLAHLSQLNQAHCVKFAVEHFRREQPRTLGALYWQLNDCWPVASWSSLEYDGAWKPLHVAARRFFAPSLVSVRHLGAEGVKIGNYPVNTKGVVELWTSHDAPAPRRARLAWRLLGFYGELLASGEKPVRLRPLESVLARRLDFTRLLDRVGRERAVLHATLLDADDGALLSEQAALFAAPRLLDLPAAPAIRATWRRAPGDAAWTLTLRSRVFQPTVWLESPDAFAAFDDNLLDLLPDEARRIRVTPAASASRARPRIGVRTLSGPMTA